MTTSGAKAKAKDWQSKAKAKTKDLEPKKAKAKDMVNWPRGSSRPRLCPRGLHLCQHIRELQTSKTVRFLAHPVNVFRRRRRVSLKVIACLFGCFHPNC